MIKKIDHIGIIVSDIEESIKPFDKLLKKDDIEKVYVENYNVEIAFIEINGVNLEFIHPLGTEGELSDFLKSGGGIHHIAIEVDDITQQIKINEQNNIYMKDKEYKYGAHNSKIAFAENSSFYGINIEFLQKKGGI